MALNAIIQPFPTHSTVPDSASLSHEFILDLIVSLLQLLIRTNRHEATVQETHCCRCSKFHRRSTETHCSDLFVEVPACRAQCTTCRSRSHSQSFTATAQICIYFFMYRICRLIAVGLPVFELLLFASPTDASLPVLICSLNLLPKSFRLQCLGAGLYQQKSILRAQ